MTIQPGPSILVGFAEALSGPEAIWSLLDAGYRVDAFHRSGRRPAIAADERVKLHAVLAPEMDADGSIQSLARLLDKGIYHALLPLDDASLWLAGRLQPTDTIVAGHTPRSMELAINKSEQLAVFGQCGLRAPESTTLRAPGEFNADAHRLTFPVILKPARAAFVLGGKLTRGQAWRCPDEPSLGRALSEWAGRWPALLQELVTGEGRGLFAMGDGRRALAPSGHRRLRMMHPAGSGSSACESTPVTPNQHAILDAFVESTGWRGLFMVEYLRDRTGRDWLMELNGRSWGSIALARRCGLEYPAWTVAQSLGETPDLPSGDAPEGVRCRHLGREIMHVIHVFRGPGAQSDTPWPSRRSTLASVFKMRRGEHWYNSMRAGVMLRDAWSTIARSVFA